MPGPLARLQKACSLLYLLTLATSIISGLQPATSRQWQSVEAMYEVMPENMFDYGILAFTAAASSDHSKYGPLEVI